MDRPVGPEAQLNRSPAIRRGEWWELKLPASISALTPEELLIGGPVPERLAEKLKRSGGVVKKGSTLRLQLFPAEPIDYAAEWNASAFVVYEDDFCLVVNKSAGMPVHPAERGGAGSLAGLVAAHYVLTGQQLSVRHIHRLDADTTGLVLYAKCSLAQLHLDKAMQEKRVSRFYIAVVEGVVKQQKGTIDAPIGRDRHDARRRRVSRNGDRAVTHYEVLERYGTHSLVRLTLDTGRTHQIRVHMAYIGHPLSGDSLYGGDGTLIGRQALHGICLVFPHPWTGERVEVEADWPEDLSGLVNKLRRQSADGIVPH